MCRNVDNRPFRVATYSTGNQFSVAANTKTGVTLAHFSTVNTDRVIEQARANKKVKTKPNAWIKNTPNELLRIRHSKWAKLIDIPKCELTMNIFQLSHNSFDINIFDSKIRAADTVLLSVSMTTEQHFQKKEWIIWLKKTVPLWFFRSLWIWNRQQLSDSMKYSVDNIYLLLIIASKWQC